MDNVTDNHMQLRRTRNRDLCFNYIYRLAEVEDILLLMISIMEDKVSVRGHIVHCVQCIQCIQ